MLTVSQIFIYPVKSLGGIALASAEIIERGFQHDRRWMLVDENNTFISQREFAEMALLQVALTSDALLVTHKKSQSNIIVPLVATGDILRVKVWSDVCTGIEVSTQVSEWFSRVLSINCKLVFMPDTTRRRVDTRYASNKEITGFTDGYPFVLIGQSSLDDLNHRLEKPLTIDRFRPNIVCTGSAPFEEDEWAHFNISNIQFYGVKLCARCVVTTIDQNEATKGKEPLKTLATYRSFNKKVYFGQNLLHAGEGRISVGDDIKIIERKKPRFPVSK